MSLVFLVTHAIFLSVSCFSFYIFSCAFSSLERYDSVSVICKYQLKSAPVTDKGTKESRLNQQGWMGFWTSLTLKRASGYWSEKFFSSVKQKNKPGFPEVADKITRLRGSRNYYRAGFTRRHFLLRFYRRWSGWTRKYGFSIWQDDIYIYYLLKPPFS